MGLRLDEQKRRRQGLPLLQEEVQAEAKIDGRVRLRTNCNGEVAQFISASNETRNRA
jgi:hypothetical protein